MALRADEKFVKDSLVEYFGGSDIIKAWEGEDPPDIYVEIEGECTAVEITTFPLPSFGPDGVFRNRKTTDYSLADLCDELDSKLKHRVMDEIHIWLDLYGPVENLGRYKKDLCDYLKRFIAEKPKVGDERVINITNEKVKIFVTRRSDNSRRKIDGTIWNKNTNPYNLYIPMNAEVILADRIKEKQKKCEKVDGPIWLALLNEVPVIDHENYAQAIKNVSIEHRFGKIFLIQNTGQVHQIYEKI